MFEVFAELKQKQSMRFVKDKGIGVGLSCSKILTEALGGSIRIVNSLEGLTEIKVTIPVKILEQREEIDRSKAEDVGINQPRCS